MTPPHSTLSRRQTLAALAAASASPALAGAAHDETRASAAALRRLFGPAADRIGLKLGTPGGPTWYEAHGRGGRLTVEGDTPVALVRGAYAALRDAGCAHVSWDGTHTKPPVAWPDMSTGRMASPFAHRAYLNTCTFGYTTPWWGWERWSREIDWMAAHGVDMPLAMEGQEYVWRALWREAGLSNEEIAGYFSGPAFTPWQRMGNLEGYQAPLPDAWIDKKHVLQTRILGRMRDLRMSPILPAFAGYVPRAFAEKHPKARIYRMRAGAGFHPTYWLDPGDPLFAELVGRFMALYDATYGPGTYYLADSFNEMTPPIAEDGSDAGGAFDDGASQQRARSEPDPAVKARRLADYGRAIHQAFYRARPDAVWTMQGWLFGADQKFWTSEAIAAYLSQIPDEGLLVLDIGNDRYPNTWKTARAFGGKRWIYGYVHNYGASNPVYGDLDYYREDLKALAASRDTKALAGFGMFPEGLDNNPIVYEAAYDLAWNAGGKTDADWLARYARARYGHTTPELNAALSQLVEAAYATRYWTPRWWKDRAGAYLFHKRPTSEIVTFGGHPGDRTKLRAAVRKLAELAPGFSQEPLFIRDLVEAARHLGSEEIDLKLMAAVAAYRRADLSAGDKRLLEAKDLAFRLDSLMGVQPHGLATWIDEARAYADNRSDAAAYVRNAKTQVTVWGGDGNLSDYASKAWQGLYRHYYWPRWEIFFAGLRTAVASKVGETDGVQFDEPTLTKVIKTWERAWIARDDPYVREVPADPIADAQALLTRLEQA
ncbi:MAG: alpha-N-acetylglucosaminidase C-terminal domain-containing protein [Proteobacteria bacterium]|nr:alpha-N-acetylglucosaminidase C-terminal domain-containing protein [Pseudomonadota bacterium]